MKELKIILLLLIPCLAYSQSPGAPEKAMSESYSANAPAAAMANTFTAQSVDQPQVGAFQKRGIQKLKDFYNYLTIISNPSYDKALRENAKNQAKQLFYGADCGVDGKIAMDFIDSCYNLSKAIEWKAVDVVVLENMTAKTNVVDSIEYHGVLTFKESRDGVVSGMKSAEIILSKSEKEFGNTKKEVWSIFICTIE